MKEAFKKIAPLAIILAVLIGSDLLQAAWTGPTATAPQNNTDAPINTGSTDQVKSGGLSVDALAVFGDVQIDGAGTLVVSNVCNNDRSVCGTVEEFLLNNGGGVSPAYLNYDVYSLVPVKNDILSSVTLDQSYEDNGDGFPNNGTWVAWSGHTTLNYRHSGGYSCTYSNCLVHDTLYVSSDNSTMNYLCGLTNPGSTPSDIEVISAPAPSVTIFVDGDGRQGIVEGNAQVLSYTGSAWSVNKNGTGQLVMNRVTCL